MRLFIGISPSDDVRRALAGMQAFLLRYGISGTYPAPENLHMTLAFIGEYPEADAVLESVFTDARLSRESTGNVPLTH